MTLLANVYENIKHCISSHGSQYQHNIVLVINNAWSGEICLYEFNGCLLSRDSWTIKENIDKPALYYGVTKYIDVLIRLWCARRELPCFRTLRPIFIFGWKLESKKKG